VIRKGDRPAFRVRIGALEHQGRFTRVFPFRRPWPVIVIVAVMFAIFAVPAVITGRQVAGQLGGVESLFDLVGVAFMGFWLLGWSVGLLIMGGILGLLLFGREVVLAGPDGVEIVLGLPLLGLGATFDVNRMRNLRVVDPKPKSGKSWRGRHFEFDYGATAIAFGSAIDAMEQGAIASGIEMASGKSIRKGPADTEDREAEWDIAPQETASAAESVDRVAESPVSTVVQPAAATGLAGWLTPATLALVIANLVPVAGAVFLGWRLSDVMVLYWAESAVVGFWNLCKILMIGRWLGLFAGMFFLGHFGGFMAVHFLFIYTIFIEGVGSGGTPGGGELAEVGHMFLRLWPALLALFISHGLSFWLNFVGRGEYRGKTVNRQMSEPYRRIVFMHLVLIFGGGLALVLGDTTPVLLIVIALKVVFDVRAHRKEHSEHTARDFVENPG
jgi:hypothetical protein